MIWLKHCSLGVKQQSLTHSNIHRLNQPHTSVVIGFNGQFTNSTNCKEHSTANLSLKTKWIFLYTNLPSNRLYTDNFVRSLFLNPVKCFFLFPDSTFNDGPA